MTNKTYSDGLRAAARVLINTADDYEQGFERRRQEIQRAEKSRELGVSGMKESLRIDQQKAQLLRGQSMRVMELCPQFSTDTAEEQHSDSAMGQNPESHQP